MDGTTWQDPRILRTKRALIDAMLALAENNEFASISISEITRLAGVNRKTFYLHYAGKDELLAEALDTLFDHLTEVSRQFLAAHGPLSLEKTPASTVALFTRLAEHPKLFRRLMGINGSSAFSERLRAFYRQQVLALWASLGIEAPEGSPPADFRAEFAAATTEGIASWWIREPRDLAPDVVSGWLWELVRPIWLQTTAARNQSPERLSE